MRTQSQRDWQWHAHQYKRMHWICLPPFFLRCYLCLSPVLLRLAYAFFVTERVCNTHKQSHTYTLTHAFAYTTHALTEMMLAEIVYDTKEVSKCVFKRTLYLDSLPLRLRSVHSLRTHEIVFVGWEMTMKMSAPYYLQLFSNTNKIVNKQSKPIA